MTIHHENITHFDNWTALRICANSPATLSNIAWKGTSAWNLLGIARDGEDREVASGITWLMSHYRSTTGAPTGSHSLPILFACVHCSRLYYVGAAPSELESIFDDDEPMSRFAAEAGRAYIRC
jgi:hypothetical protein